MKIKIELSLEQWRDVLECVDTSIKKADQDAEWLRGRSNEAKYRHKYNFLIEIFESIERQINQQGLGKDVAVIYNQNRKLSVLLKRLQEANNGILLNHTIDIFYNDWAKNPDLFDDYSERVIIAHKKLKDINSNEYEQYTVLWSDVSVYCSSVIDICCEKIRQEQT